MTIPELLINVMGPVVAIVAIGWLAGTQLTFDMQTLARLAFWVIGPAFVLDVFSDAQLETSVVQKLVIGGVAGMIAAALFAVVVGRLAGLDRRRTQSATMASAYGNVGNAGLAISVFAFGQGASALAAVLMIVVNTFGTMLGIGLATADRGSPAQALVRAIAAPMPLASIVAIVMNVFELSFPLVLDRSIELMSGALIPLMLLTLGMQLAAARSFRAEPELGIVGVAKLAVAPIAAALVGSALGLEGTELGVLVIQSAMPPAVFCVVVAVEFDFEPERTTRTVLGTTMIALVTLPFVLAAVT